MGVTSFTRESLAEMIGILPSGLAQASECIGYRLFTPQIRLSDEEKAELAADRARVEAIVIELEEMRHRYDSKRWKSPRRPGEFRRSLGEREVG